MPRLSSKLGRRTARGAAAMALIAATPKCGLCIVGYLGLGAAIGLRPTEVCGATAEDPLLWVGCLAAGILGALALWRLGRAKAPPPTASSAR